MEEFKTWREREKKTNNFALHSDADLEGRQGRGEGGGETDQQSKLLAVINREGRRGREEVGTVLYN